MFDVDKWKEENNKKLASAFEATIRKLEALFRKDAQQQVEMKRSEIKENI